MDVIDAATSSGDIVGYVNAVKRVVALVRLGSTDRQIWHDIGIELDRRSRLAAVENKREQALEANIRVDKVFALMGALAELVKQNVSNSDEANRIYAGMEAFIGRAVEAGVLPSGRAETDIP